MLYTENAKDYDKIDLIDNELEKLKWKHCYYGAIDIYTFPPTFANHRTYLEIDFKNKTYRLYDYFHHKITPCQELEKVLKIIDLKEKEKL